jgi:hypothetical protein
VVQYVDVKFTPDTDTNWKVAPGALTYVNALAPLQGGMLGSMGTANYFTAATLTGSNHLTAQTFRQINGSVRFLTFRTADIDEYDNAASRTNRGTGYTATMWSATAWGNQIIATDYVDAPQSSTGAGFSALSGSPPKARMVASNVDFVMFADVNDGGSNVYSDMVWWGGLRNPATWTPSPATQAGNQRILQAPGPIRALVAYGKNFVVFKDNAIIVGEYIAGKYIFGWQMVSSRVGCVGQNAVCELDGKLYFLHTSGFYEFDGQQIRNIGIPVFQSFLTEAQYVSGTASTNVALSGTGTGIGKVIAVADDIEGVVWFETAATAATPLSTTVFYGYNPRCGKWGRTQTTSKVNNVYPSPMVRTTSSDMQAFLTDATGRFWFVSNDSVDGTTLKSVSYPYATNLGCTYTTGVWGDQEDGAKNQRIYLRHRPGSTALTVAADVTASITGYADEAQNTAYTTVSSVFNVEYQALDHTADARYKTMTAGYASGKKIILAGMGLNEVRTGKR